MDCFYLRLVTSPLKTKSYKYKVYHIRTGSRCQEGCAIGSVPVFAFLVGDGWQEWVVCASVVWWWPCTVS